ncbi:MAG: hydrolase [Victivallaceae bacterium]|jgi:nicotinamidase-related amidase|nr:hydrolase [Victivallaceae bacterium]MDD4318469.1 hydrolase [Victivallaceae bacterium]MDD5663915.1 hydrolase [Victivallaceae bacterium]
MIIPEIENSIFILVDVQEKLLPAMNNASGCLDRNRILLKSAAELGIKVIASEQYPQGLGGTVEELKNLFCPDWTVVEKNTFSCFGAEPFVAELKKSAARNLFISGIESHVCVLQTALDARDDYQVFVISDAVTSRKAEDYTTALQTMRQNGIQVISTESILFMLMRSSKHQAFKAISKLIR